MSSVILPKQYAYSVNFLRISNESLQNYRTIIIKSDMRSERWIQWRKGKTKNRRGYVRARFTFRQRRRDVNAALSRCTCATARAHAPTPRARVQCTHLHTHTHRNKCVFIAAVALSAPLLMPGQQLVRCSLLSLFLAQGEGPHADGPDRFT